MAIRKMGKASFIHIMDASGQIQVFIKSDVVGENVYEAFKLLDIGDFVGINGIVFKTKTKEVSINTRKFIILSKSIRPLPIVKEKEGEVQELAKLLANERILDILFPDEHKDDPKISKDLKDRHARTRERIRKKMENDAFEEKMIEIEISDEPSIGMQVFGPMGMEDIGMNIKDMLAGQFPKNKRSKKMTVAEARKVWTEDDAAKLVDQDEIIRIIVFLHEQKAGHQLWIEDKVCVGPAGSYFGWGKGIEHMAANLGSEDRYILQVTGIK